MATKQSVVTSDGVRLSYRLDGSSDPKAPLIVLSNPSLVDLSLWDECTDLFFADAGNKKYRLLRYNNRGRVKNTTGHPLTVDILTEDLVTLLDELKVEKAAAMTGLSLGSIAILNFARKYPHRVGSIMPCDFPPTSPPTNGVAWGARVALAREDKGAPVGPDGSRVIGDAVAEVMLEKWLCPKFLNDRRNEAKVKWLQKMVRENYLDGLVSIVEAITSYDVTGGVEEMKVPALFAAGADDSLVLAGMKDLAQRYGNSPELQIIPDAGHVSVVEQPEHLVRLLGKCLESSSEV